MAGTPQFVDVSAYQGTIDFHAYCAWAKQWDGISRMAIKSTEGVGFTDPGFAANRAGALAAGIDMIIYYHFARPDLGNSPANEANWCYSMIGDIRDSDVIMLDYEVEDERAIAVWAYEWLVQQEAIYGGKLPGIYTSSAYIQQRLQDTRLASFPLWLANWQFTPDARPPIPAPWTSYEAVQYTDRANIPGIAGAVDANIFLGGPLVNNITYGPGSPDFNQWFTASDGDHWTCKQTGVMIQFGNLGLYRSLTLAGVLPVIGLPLENEQYHAESDNYHWSTQRFERATMIYDPDHRFDSQPGMGASYLEHADRVQQPSMPSQLATSIQTVVDDVAAMQKIASGLPTT